MHVSVVIKMLTKEFAKIAFVCINLAYKNLLMMQLNTGKSWYEKQRSLFVVPLVLTLVSETAKGIPVHGLVCVRCGKSDILMVLEIA